MSTHARIFGRTAQASFGLTIAALALALGAGPALAVPQQAVPGDDPVNNAMVQGFVWKDTNRDGVRAAKLPAGDEPPIGSVTVYLLKPGADESKLPEVAAQLAAGQQVEPPNGWLQASTGGNGKYGYNALAAGVYRLVIFPNTRWPEAALTEQLRITTPHAGNDTSLDSDFTEKVGHNGKKSYYFADVKDITLGKGTLVKLDLGVTDPKPEPEPDPDPAPNPEPKNNGVACVQAWNDKDKDGLREEGEAPIAGLLVHVEEAAAASEPTKLRSLKNGLRGKKTAEQEDLPLTDADGRYCFTKLKTGSYVAYLALGPIVFENGHPVGITKEWTLTKKDVGSDDDIDSDFTLYANANAPELDGKFGITDTFGLKDDAKVTVDGGLFKDETSPAPSPSPSPGGEGGGDLPTTGSALGGVLAAGALLLGGGVALTIAARRRRRTTA